MAREVYLITFTANGIAPISVLPDESPATVQSGYGGWSVVSRQHRIGLTVWHGKDPLRMSVPILFDGLASGLSQEIAISRLSRMALPPSIGGEPPVVTVSGASVPRPGPTQWVIENLQWGTKVIYDFAGNGAMVRLRQDCVVNLLEYRAEDRVAFKGLMPGGASSGPSKVGWPKIYTVKSGDDLRTIAARKDMYGDAKKWKLIAKANNIRDYKSVKKNQKLRVPAP